MKKALIVITAFTGYEVGQLVRVGEAIEIDSLNGNHYNNMIKINVGASIEDLPVDQLESTLIPAADSHYSDGINSVPDAMSIPQIDDGSGNMISDPSYLFVAAVLEHWEVQINAVGKVTADITSLYNTMTNEILAQMAVIFGTNSVDSALSYEATWKEMALTPSDYSGANLSARFAVAGMAIGDSLNTEQRVLDYANAKIVEVKAYAVWRMQRIEQFRDNRDVLLGV